MRRAVLVMTATFVPAVVPAITLAVPAPAQPPGPSAARPQPEATDCLGGQGYLRARIRGALNRDLDFRQHLTCEGESRPDGSGIHLGFAAPPGPHRLRLIFGIRGVREGVAGRELPVNLTVMEEGGRIFATRGESRCTIDDLQQRRQPGGSAHTWRITVRGFCTDPVNALGQSPAQSLGKGGRIVVSRFDFAGVVTFASGR